MGGTASGFGASLKRELDEAGNVCWNFLSCGNEMSRVGDSSFGPAIYNDFEGTYVACHKWFEEFAKTKYTPIKSLVATQIELEEVHKTVYPGDVRPITLLASFQDGRRWNVAGDTEWVSSDESVLTVIKGNIHVKSEGKVTVSGTYTDGTGQVFKTQFDVTSSLFPLTADGIVIYNGSYDENTHTFSEGHYRWDYGGEVLQWVGVGSRNWNQRGGLDFSAYKYLVARMNDQASFGTIELYDKLTGTYDGAAAVYVQIEGRDEIVIDLHAYSDFDPSHVTAVAIGYGPVSIKEIFLSNDGVNPAGPYTMPTLVTADDMTMYYGDVPQLTYSVSGYGNVGTPKLTTTATSTSPVGSYDILIEGDAEGVTYKPGKLTILPAPLTITADDIVMNPGTDVPELTLTYDGLKGGETAETVLSELPTAVTTATKDSPCGNYGITVSGGSAANYELAWHPGTLTIAPFAGNSGLTLSDSYTKALAEAEELLLQKMSVHVRGTLHEAMGLEQTYRNYYRLSDAIAQAKKSIEAMAYASKALDVTRDELLTVTNVCTPEAKDDYLNYYNGARRAYDEDWLTDDKATEMYNPYAGGGGGSYWQLVTYMMSAWEYNMGNTFFMQGAPYGVCYCDPMESPDKTGFNKPFIEYNLAEGNTTLEARTLKATMTGMKPGKYTATVRVRLRVADDESGAPRGLTLQVCNGKAEPVSGQRIDDFYQDTYTATGVVGDDGVLNIMFHVSADNNLGWMAFRDLNVSRELGVPVKDGWYIVETPEQLVEIAEYATANPTINIRIASDLDMSEVTEQYKPIRGAYSGTFDGGYHTISNLIIDNVPNETTAEGATVVDDQALIGLAGGCTVKNLTLDATCSINGGGYSAGFVGETTGDVTIIMENLFMHGNVRAEGPNGAGIYACNMETSATVVMTNCGVSGKIWSENEGGAVSGWFGEGKATVTNCWFTGTIEGCDDMAESVFCRPAKDVTLTNCWSYLGSRDGVGKLSSKDAASSGELTWSLNGGRTDNNAPWRQNLGDDLYPTLDPTHKIVYKTADGSYTNQFQGGTGGNAFRIEDMTVCSGKSFILPVSMENLIDVAAFQCDISLPDGITLQKDGKGKYDIALDEDRKGDHTVSCALQPDGSFRIVVASLTLSTFSGTEGTLFRMNLQAAGNMAGEKTVSITNIHISESDGTRYELADASATVTIQPYTLADVNNDSMIAIDDVVLSINGLLGDFPENFVFAAADMNGDGLLLVDDVVQIINAVLNADLSSVQSKVRGAETGETLSLSGYEGGFSVTLDNAGAYTAMQFDIHLPEGAGVEDIRIKAGDGHRTVFSRKENGVVRAVVVSLSNKCFSGEYLLDVMIDAADDAEIQITNARLASRNGSVSKLHGASVVVKGNTTGIGRPMDSMAKSDIYDISGRLVKKGATTTAGLKKGVYFINGKKVELK